jgi:hypothetical protein
MSRIFLFVCLVLLTLVPPAGVAAQQDPGQSGVQGIPDHEPYYDPRYIPQDSNSAAEPAEWESDHGASDDC